MEIRRATILGFTLFMAGLVLSFLGLWLLLSSAQYRAATRMEINPESRDTTGIGQFVPYDPYFIQTEFEIMQSQIVLGRVIDSLNLNAKWSGKYAAGGTLTTNAIIAILKRHLRIALVRNTKLVEISYTSEDPDEAAKVANAIAKAYQDYRMETRRQMALKGIEGLQQEFQDEEKKIQIQQTNVDLLGKEELHITNGVIPLEVLQKWEWGKTNRIEIHEATPDQPYWEAKRKLNQMIDFHKLLQAKMTALKLDLEIPKTMVPIVDVAQPPKSPAGPNRFLGAVLLIIGLLPTVSGFLMLKSARHRSCAVEL